MPSLLDMTTQGDVATIGDESKLSEVKLLDPRQLYDLWERQHWLSQEIDFAQDVRDWRERIGEEDRDDLMYGLASFFIGEERVTTQFSGLVMAYEDEDEEAFLTTQQVDEARHVKFFDRFFREVLAFDEDDIHKRLEHVREYLNDAFVALFDEALVEAGNQLIASPGDRDAKIDFVTTYHMVIEGTLALTGQHFLTEAFSRRGLMPGFVDGFERVSRDEHRHVAFGTWYLQQQVREDPSVKERIQAKLVELLPHAAGVLVPKGKSIDEDWTIFGYSNLEVNEFAFTALTRRLKVIGVPLPTVAAA